MTGAAPPPSDPRDAYRATHRFEALDGLRALAAAAVVWHHSGDYATGFFGRSVGVTTFFVISGFLITRLLLRERDETGTIAVGRFLRRRALRIFPLYYAVLAVYVLLVARLGHGDPARAGFFANLPWYLTFTANWFVNREPGERVIFYFAWSIALQEQFYLVWPIILRLVRKRFAIVFPFAFLVLGDLSSYAVGIGWIDGGLLHRILVAVDSPIFLGVLAAMLLETGRGLRIALAMAGRPWSVPLGLALVLLPAAWPALPQDLLGVFITYLVVACVLAPPAAVRVVGNPVLRHVGNVSLGIYLLHTLSLNAVRHALPGRAPWVAFALGFPLAIAAATASRRWFEQPFLRLRDAPPSPGGAARSVPAAAGTRSGWASPR